jgi:tripartite-type tricarboxylate transporter receptor subunit TctC
MEPVQYRGGIPGITALIAGEVSIGFTDLMTTLPHVKAGKLRLIAVTSARRSPVIPDTPTVAESGLRGFGVTAWFGLVTRAGTPKPVIDKLNQEILRILQLPDTRKRLAALGSELGTLTADEFGEFLRDETAKWAKVINTAMRGRK